MLRLHKKGQQAFTLIETLIYSSITAIVLSSLLSYIFLVSSVRNKNYIREEIQSNLRIVLDFISKEIRMADEIILPTKGTSSSILRLTSSSTEITFFLSKGQVFITKDGTTTPITSSQIYISSIDFSNSSVLGNKDIINIKLGANNLGSAGSVDYRYNLTLHTSAQKRK